VADVAALPDRVARDRIATDLETTLFVEAGAGSGKTTALVTRIVALVSTGAAELADIAAITFTDKAAAELRDRVRRALEQSADTEPAGESGRRCRVAVDQLDRAAIGTLHSFAQRILTEHPVEAGLPPRVEVLDEVSSSVEFERRWATFRDELLAEPGLERTLLLLLACGVKASALRSLAQAFDDNWDLVAERVPETAPEPPPVCALLHAALAPIDNVCAQRDHCTKPGSDRLLERLDTLAAYADGLRAYDDEVDVLEALDRLPSFKVGNIGRGGDWDLDLAQFRLVIRNAGDGLTKLRADVADACARRLASAIRAFTLAAAGERRRAGHLEFHDLLVLARSLLRDPDQGPVVRARLHLRYQRLLLDEFQDTDPIQIELAVRIAAADPLDGSAGSEPWDSVSVASGHLFVVGDPKQSIYRFRRADISVFLAAERRFGPAGGGVVELTTNFRTGKAVIEWVNQVFALLMAESPDVEMPVPSQPEYHHLTAVRAPPPNGAPVAVLGRTPHPPATPADALRALEAAEVAAVIARAIAEQWSVDDGAGSWRPARLGDVAVLVPSRTSLPFLEDTLDEAGIPFRAESSSLVYATRAVRDLMMVLRAVDDPSDALRIVAALRTPLLACGDDDLFRFKVEGKGRWSYLATQPATIGADDPVRAGLDYLRSLHDGRLWQSPSELLDRVSRDRRAFELGFTEKRPRDVWRRLRFVIDQARAWSEAAGGNLRQYLRWIELQTSEGARVAESVLPETDDDAVRIMTIHGAKGLEFPITVVSGLSTVPQARPAPAQVVFPPTGAPGYKFGAAVTTQEFADWAPVDEQMGFDERIRLLYVACTRARDHLVVSLHRKERTSSAKPSSRTSAELLVQGMGDALDQLPDGFDHQRVLPLAEVEAPRPPPPLEDWAAERSLALIRAGRPTAIAATALSPEGSPDVAAEPDPGLQKRPPDLDVPPWLKGRYGTSVGRAVHGVLQTIDLATGDGIDAAVAAQCEAEAVPDRAADVRTLVGHALRSASVIEAARCPHWREVYACTPLGSRLLEGYLDLLYRSPDGLVVVDHKTSASSQPDELARRVEGYRLQGAAYALAIAAAAGEPVVRVTFLFLTPSGAFERHLDDLDGAVEQVRVLVADGREITADRAN
jgi:ATP-dependent helicase/nuclease subunit A